MNTDRRLFAVLGLALSAAWLLSSSPTAAQDGEALLNARCAACHEERAGGALDRIADARKTPEGWDMTLVRMMVVHGVELNPDERRALVKHLADTRGLAPSETEGYRYILERTPGVMDAAPTDDLHQMCARCHTWARVALQRRPKEDWLKLMHFHLGQYPTAEYQALGRDRDWWTIAATTVVDELASRLPLETEHWAEWKNLKAPDLSGEWRFVGWQPGAGANEGRATLTATEPDHYSVAITSRLADGTEIESEGTAVLYSGHELRASLKTGDGIPYRNVLSTRGDPATLNGRWFLTDNDVIGGAVSAARDDGTTRVMAVVPGYVKAGETATVAVNGVGLTDELDLGEGLTVKVVSHSPDKVIAEVAVAADAATGLRDVKVGGAFRTGLLTVYDEVAAVKVEPAQTIARVGGNDGPIEPVPAQFEAVGYMAGPDGEAGTDDDVRIGVMPASWSVENFDETAVELEDARFAGEIDESGLFSPAAAGPNPDRPMNTNNAGNLKVVATVSDGGKTVEGNAQLFVTVQRFVDPPIR